MYDFLFWRPFSISEKLKVFLDAFFIFAIDFSRRSFYILWKLTNELKTKFSTLIAIFASVNENYSENIFSRFCSAQTTLIIIFVAEKALFCLKSKSTKRFHENEVGYMLHLLLFFLKFHDAFSSENYITLKSNTAYTSPYVECINFSFITIMWLT